MPNRYIKCSKCKWSGIIKDNLQLPYTCPFDKKCEGIIKEITYKEYKNQ
jgi:hypothetical protein